MVIGIDASRAFISDKTGTENYSFHLINAMLRLPESKKHFFVLFTRPNPILPKELDGYSNVIIKEVRWRYLWTQLGLAWETWNRHQILDSRLQLDALWIPAHTLPILRNPKVKTVVTIHGLEYQWLPEYKNWLQRWYLPLSTFYAAKSANKLIAVSNFTAKQLQEVIFNVSKKTRLHRYAKHCGQVKVIHEGVISSSRAQSRDPSTTVGMTLEKYGLQPKNYILFVGSIQPRKNLVALVEAFSQTKIEKLVIAGGIGWLADEVLRAPSRHGVQERVVFTGRVSDSDLRELYLGAQAYVQPSITEGFGLPVLEAMAYGVPVISSDGGALGEVVGSAGLIVQLRRQNLDSRIQYDQFFVERLAEAMERVNNDKKLRNRLISMGSDRVKDFTWERAAKTTLMTLVG